MIIHLTMVFGPKFQYFFQLNEMRDEAKTWWLYSGPDVASSYFLKRKSVSHLNHEPSFGYRCYRQWLLRAKKTQRPETAITQYQSVKWAGAWLQLDFEMFGSMVAITNGSKIKCASWQFHENVICLSITARLKFKPKQLVAHYVTHMNVSNYQISHFTSTQLLIPFKVWYF